MEATIAADRPGVEGQQPSRVREVSDLRPSEHRPHPPLPARTDGHVTAGDHPERLVPLRQAEVVVYKASMTTPILRRNLWWISVATLACTVVTLDGAHQVRQRTPAPKNDPNHPDWVQLFNGRDLDGWTPKFAKHDLGENFNDTFRVENGLLEVRYDKWTRFDGEFGHLFYKEPFSYYRLVAEYRFVGDQVPGG